MNVEDEFALQLYAAFNYNVPSPQIVSPDTHLRYMNPSTATGSILSIKSLERPSTPQQFIKSPALDQAYPLVTAEYFPVLKNDKAVQSSPIQLYDPSWHSLDSIGASGEESHLDHSTSVESGSTETIQSEKSIASPTSLDGDAWSEFAALSHAKTCTSRRTMLSEPHTSSSRPFQRLPLSHRRYPPVPSVTSSMVAHAGHGDSGSTNAASIVNTDALTSRPRVTSPEYFATPLLSPTISSASSLSLSSEFRDYSVTGFSPGSSNSSRTLPPLPTYVEIGVGPDRPLSPDSLGDAVRTPTVSILPDLDDYTPGSSVLAVD
ncbi:hypothetical protein DL96DRAFT_1714185 [Flagelloscypha sp. PMI_526]|nr:hypothetical protein DL96DRAFT_1714185 [Flagelloscypha sp. PMI_526]